MKETGWIIIALALAKDSAGRPSYEVAAQRMRGWRRDGPTFQAPGIRKTLDVPSPDEDMAFAQPSAAPGVPAQVLRAAIGVYAGGDPLCSFGQSEDVEEFLAADGSPARPGAPCVCLRRLAERLLDPLPVGAYDLDVLRSYLNLPRRGETAQGRADTIADLVEQVLAPLILAQNLVSWERLVDFTLETWHPSCLPFGPFKGRRVTDARVDAKLLDWLRRLAAGPSGRGAAMAQWHLARLERTAGHSASYPGGHVSMGEESGSSSHAAPAGLAVWRDPGAARLREAIERARMRLSALEAELMALRWDIQAASAAVYRLVAPWYRRRDRLRLAVDYRRRFLDALFAGGEKRAQQKAREYATRRDRLETEYDQADREAAEKQEMSEDQRAELESIFKSLVRLHHPDRHVADPERHAAMTRLLQVVNVARDCGDLALLRDIAADTPGFIERQGWGRLDVAERDVDADLADILASLQTQILERLEAVAALRKSEDHAFALACRQDPDRLTRAADQSRRSLAEEIDRLEAEAAALEEEIAALTGAESAIAA